MTSTTMQQDLLTFADLWNKMRSFRALYTPDVTEMMSAEVGSTWEVQRRNGSVIKIIKVNNNECSLQEVN